MKKDFTKIAISSRLFKGQSGWYYCYLKSEKIAHVLTLLTERALATPDSLLGQLAQRAAEVPARVLHVVAGEASEEALLADLFNLLSTLRLSSTKGQIDQDNVQVLLQEYEKLIEQISDGMGSTALSVSMEDFSVPLPAREPSSLALPSFAGLPSEPAAIKDIKDIYKRHTRAAAKEPEKELKGQKGRLYAILEVIKQNNGVSIKDISSVVRDCSEKTIQRELSLLIEQGLVLREGQRRWSVYKTASTS